MTIEYDPGLVDRLCTEFEDGHDRVKVGLEDAARLALIWGVRLTGWLPEANFCLVLCGSTGSGREVVLRVPLVPEERDSLPAILAFADCGGVSVLRHEESTGSALMPWLRPGTTLADDSLTDLEATDICADLILRLRTATPTASVTLERWMDELTCGAHEAAIVQDAASTARRLLESAPAPTLLHADLHHYNILRDGAEWVAIDPKGILGDPSFEVTAFMRNPVDRIPGPDALATRLERFAERLDDPPERLWGWTFAQTVISFVWGSRGEWRDSWQAAAEHVYSLRARFT